MQLHLPRQDKNTGIGKLIHREEKLEAGAVQQRRKENSGIAGLVALALLLLLLGVVAKVRTAPALARQSLLLTPFLPFSMQQTQVTATRVQQRRKENSGIAGLVALALLLLLLGVANGTDRCPCILKPREKQQRDEAKRIAKVRTAPALARQSLLLTLVAASPAA
jgi:uncharacterized membrane protein